MNKSNLSAERARELLSYDPETGSLKWRVTRSNRAPAGSEAGYRRKDGYTTVRVDGKLYLAHRVAWLIHTGAWPEHIVDHRNGTTSDTRIANLRDCARRVNQENLRHARSDSVTGILGASPKRNKFRARIFSKGKEVNLGVFPTPEGAHQAYLSAKRELHAGCTI